MLYDSHIFSILPTVSIYDVSIERKNRILFKILYYTYVIWLKNIYLTDIKIN